MLYLVAGILKPGSKERLLALRDEFNDHLGDAAERISLFGVLRSEDGERRGYLGLIKAKDFDDAQAYLKQSPFYEYELYQQVEVAEFVPEVGNLE